MTRSFYWSLRDVTSALWLWSLDVVFCQKEPELIEKSCFHFWVRKCTNVQDESRVFFITEIKFSWYTEFMSKWLQNKHEKISIGQSEYLGKKKNICLGLKHIKYVKSVDPFTSPKQFKKKKSLNIYEGNRKQTQYFEKCEKENNPLFILSFT